MNQPPPSPRVDELRKDWRTLLGAALGAGIGVHGLPFYTSGIFMVALQADKGWSRSAISLGTTFFALGLALSAPLIGSLCDRFGERRMIVPGLIVQVCGLTALSYVETLSAFYLLMGGMALIGAMCGTTPYARIVNRRFHLAKGTALALMITVTACVSAVGPVAIQSVIHSYSWRIGYLALAANVVVIAPIALMLLPSEKAHSFQHTDLAHAPLLYGRLFRERTFLLILTALLLVALAVPGVITHLAAMLKDVSVEPQRAALLVGLVGLTQIVARLGTGMLSDHLFAPRLAAAIFAISALGLAIFDVFGTGLAAVAAIAVGLAYGAEIDILAYLVGRYYRPEHFGRIYGILCSVVLAGTGISPLWYGWSADHLGNYHIALAVSGGAMLISALLFCILPAFPSDIDTEK